MVAHQDWTWRLSCFVCPFDDRFLSLDVNSSTVQPCHTVRNSVSLVCLMLDELQSLQVTDIVCVCLCGRPQA